MSGAVESAGAAQSGRVRWCLLCGKICRAGLILGSALGKLRERKSPMDGPARHQLLARGGSLSW